MNSKSKNALNHYYQWFGERAYSICGKPGIINKPGVISCSGCGATGRLHSSEQGYHSFCDLCVTVAGSYNGIKRPGRLGAGWAAIITPHTHQLKRNKVKYLQYMHDIIRFIYLYMMIRNGYFLKGCSSIAICSDR